MVVCFSHELARDGDNISSIVMVGFCVTDGSCVEKYANRIQPTEVELYAWPEDAAAFLFW